LKINNNYRLIYDIILVSEGYKQCLHNVCGKEITHSNYNTINVINTYVTEPANRWNNSNIVNNINTIYIGFASTYGSEKKYRQCCGKQCKVKV